MASAYGQPKRALRVAGTELEKPVVLPATNVTRQGFTANWQPVAGADAYCVFVYTHQKIAKSGTYAVIDEGFDGVTFGSLNDPVWAEDTYMMLDEYTNLPNWSVYEGSFVKSMVGGIVYSPYIDLRNDEGKYRVVLDVYSDIPNDSVVVRALTSDKPTQSVGARMDPNNPGELVFNFTNGGHDTFFSITNMEGVSFFVDNVRVEQDLKAGDDVYTMVALNEEVMASDGTSADFKKLDFAPGATEVYYDLYAAARIYNDPNDEYDYEQVYSPFSDMQKVELSDATSVSGAETSGSSISCGRGFITVTNAAPARLSIYDTGGRKVSEKTVGAGSQNISLPAGCYIVRNGGTVKKVVVR